MNGAGYAERAQYQQRVRLHAISKAHRSRRLQGSRSGLVKSVNKDDDSINGRKELRDVVAALPDNGRINAASKNLHYIGAVSTQLQSAVALLLGNNYLRSLDGIEQFTGLQTLSLANNPLSALEALAALNQLPLKSLYLEGCPVVHNTNYRCHVISLIPTLSTLDNIAISAADRTFAEISVAKEDAMLNLMFNNDCTIGMLEKACQKIRLHSELVETAFGRNAVFNRTHFSEPAVHNVSTEKFLALIELVAHEPKSDVRRRLFADIRRRWDSAYTFGDKHVSLRVLADSWDCCTSESLADQQGRIAALIQQFEQEKSDARAQLRRLVAKQMSAIGRKQVSYASSTLQSNLKGNHIVQNATDNRQVDNSITDSNDRKQMPQRSGARKKASVLYDMMEKEPKAATFMPVPATPPHSRDYHAVSSNKQTDEVGQLRSLNLRLMERLELFQNQNSINIEQAESEVSHLTVQLQAVHCSLTLANSELITERRDRQRLQDLVASSVSDPVARLELETRIQELEKDLCNAKKDADTANINSQCEQIRLERQIAKLKMALQRKEAELSQITMPKLRVVRRQIEEYTESDEAYRQLVERLRDAHELADGYRQELIQRDEQSDLVVSETLASSYFKLQILHNFHLASKAISKWKRRVHLQWIARRNFVKRNWRRIKHFFHSWVLFKESSAAARALQYVSNLRERRRRFTQWQKFIVRCRVKTQNKLDGSELCRHHQRRRLWKLWKIAITEQNPANSDLSSAEVMATKEHKRKLCIKSWSMWRLWMISYIRPRRQLRVLSQTFRYTVMVSKGWTIWKNVFADFQESVCKFNRAVDFASARILMRAFTSLLCASTLAKRKNSLRHLSRLFLIRRNISAWRSATKKVTYGRYRLQDLVSVFSRKHRNSIFLFWRSVFLRCIAQNRFSRRSLQCRSRQLKQTAFSHWQQSYFLIRSFAGHLLIWHRRQKHLVLETWRKQVIWTSRHRRREGKIGRYVRNIIERRCRMIFFAWRGFRAYRQSALRTQTLIKDRACKRLMLSVLRKWSDQRTRRHADAVHSHMQILNALLEESSNAQVASSAKTARLEAETEALRSKLVEQTTCLESDRDKIRMLELICNQMKGELIESRARESSIRHNLVDAQNINDVSHQDRMDVECEWSLKRHSLEDRLKQDQLMIGKQETLIEAVRSVLDETVHILEANQFDNTASIRTWILRSLQRVQKMLQSNLQETMNQSSISIPYEGDQVAASLPSNEQLPKDVGPDQCSLFKPYSMFEEELDECLRQVAAWKKKIYP